MDSLDAMLLMGLENEYERALPIINQTNFSLPTNICVPFFKTIIQHLDLRFTSHIINNMLFLIPKQKLLYVTDVNTWRCRVTPTHRFEHLTCFFPSILVLCVHLLPLNYLNTLSINVTALAHHGVSPDLAQFNLVDLHLWVAEGLVQTCYLTYADQPSGLGSKIAQMDINPES
ncbi:hypothetical protein HD554DRAFT_2173801 [Boletus coccyginus]|nr:hypothetical protein HD554DRAFT_2173801 [Boletus coccyginus]